MQSIRRISLLLIAVALLVWFMAGHGFSPRIQSHLDSTATLTTNPSLAPSDSSEEPSHLADALNLPTGSVDSDLRILDEIFTQYRSATHDLNPVGENTEITATLTGKNKIGFAFIPRNHPAINSKGELCDRWGTPFFFHALSGSQMQIRSAGPDRKLWTPDDDVITPGAKRPSL